MKHADTLLTLVLVAAAGCDAAPLPVSVANPDARPPVMEDGVPVYETAAEILRVHDVADARPADLEVVFYRGRGVARDAEGRAYVPDPQGSRVLVIGADLSVERVIGGPDEEDGGLGQPLSAAPTPDGALFVTDVETQPGLRYFDAAGAYVGAANPPVANAEVRAAPDGDLWAARSPYVLRFDETADDEPLLYRFDPLEGTGAAIAVIDPVAAAGWNRASNAGPVVVGPDGRGYFGFFLRNELRAYEADGTLAWRVRRILPYETYEPEFVGEGESLRYNVRPVTQALSIGPDGLLYALTVPDSLPGLSAPGNTPGERRLEVWDPADGTLRRSGIVPAGWTSFAADAEGRVFRIDPAVVEADAPEPVRPRLPSISLTGFDGEATTFAATGGKARLVNLWASWCAPCREELPQLEAYYKTLDHDLVEFLAIGVDAEQEAGRAFIEAFDLSFPVYYGGPRMQESFHYAGLPFTLIVDARGRVIEEFTGFGSGESWSRLTGLLEAEMEVVRRTAGDVGGHEHETPVGATAHEHETSGDGPTHDHE